MNELVTRLLRFIPEQPVKGVDRRLLHRRQDVAVLIDGRRDLRVTKALAHDLRMHTLLEQHRRVGVAQIVKSQP